MSEDYTYHRPLVVGKNGALFLVVHADEFDALREQVAKLADYTTLSSQTMTELSKAMSYAVNELVERNNALTQRVNALEQAQRPQPTGVVSVVDWEDNL